ncbi:MAG: response regulator [Clostridiales bacterium]|nr:response regulator [Clostridiales bacterium]
MNILLVDDNTYVLRGLQAGIHYDLLGISSVFTARNIKGAKDLMRTCDIPLVLTDIEMPGGTGLALLEWINENYPDTVTIFCTSFADFDYAQKAVQLHSFSYYLKPIRYTELQELLKKATDEVRRRQAVRKQKQYGMYWLDNLSVQKTHFWEDALLNVDSYDEDELEFLAQSRHLSYDHSQKFTLSLLKFEKEQSRMDGFSVKLERFIMHNVMSELLSDTGVQIETMMKCKKDRWLLILSHTPELSDKQIHDFFVLIINEIDQVLQCPVNIYYAYMIEFSTIRSRYLDMEKVYQDAVYDRSEVVNVDSWQSSFDNIQLTQLSYWEALFRQKEITRLLKEIKKYLEGQAEKSPLSRKKMREIRITIMQMIYTVLWERQVDAGRLFLEPEYDRLLENSQFSIDHMLNYMEYVFSRAAEHVEDTSKTENAVEIVKNYIDGHFREPITLEDLGKLVYLSSGYLAKSFKKATGTSLGNYMIDCRINLAKKLLMSGDYSVSQAASLCGYDNYTYFSRIFKNKTGMSPKEYKNSFSLTNSK